VSDSRILRWLALLALLLAMAPQVLAGVLDDPTRPPGYRLPGSGKAPFRGWHLSGIWIRAGQRLALINGRLVRPGQHIDGAQLLAVSPTAVRLRKGERIITVRLLPHRVKQAIPPGSKQSYP